MAEPTGKRSRSVPSPPNVVEVGGKSGGSLQMFFKTETSVICYKDKNYPFPDTLFDKQDCKLEIIGCNDSGFVFSSYYEISREKAYEIIDQLQKFVNTPDSPPYVLERVYLKPNES